MAGSERVGDDPAAGTGAESTRSRGSSDADPARLVVTGATGRMGQEVRQAASDRDDVFLDGLVTGEPGSVRAAMPTYDSLDAALSDDRVDCVVDFTTPDATSEFAGVCATHGVALVTGTTGLDDDAEAAIDDASESVPVLHASNFSRGVAALRAAVREVAGSLPGYDVEVTETHHDGKRDAPSGTAATLVGDVEAERPDLTTRQHGREGEAPREPGEIGIHARRAGDVTGHHEVLFAGNRETLSLSHRAGDRGVFAEGALDAAAWLADRPAGRYEFAEVLA